MVKAYACAWICPDAEAMWEHLAMNSEISPRSIAAPAANYAHAMLVTNPARTLYTSGVVPTQLDGTVPQSLHEQVEVVWANIIAILAEAEMTVTDIVSITTYVIDGEPLNEVMAVRDRYLGDHRSASTLITVPALARPVWRIEISVVAAA
jgi:2-iminobutanoate/2-iminopropanoate deaminase